MVNKQEINQIAYWNSRIYGNAIYVSSKVMRVALIVLCCATPCTNWLIPFVCKLVKRDLRLRY